jgi:hypothetical protein
MAGFRPRAIADAPSWAEAQRRTTAAGLSCPARRLLGAGEESSVDGVAAQAIEAKPALGQIKPSAEAGLDACRKRNLGDDAGLLAEPFKPHPNGVVQRGAFAHD